MLKLIKANKEIATRIASFLIIWILGRFSYDEKLLIMGGINGTSI
jgi:hypothetical protein